MAILEFILGFAIGWIVKGGSVRFSNPGVPVLTEEESRRLIAKLQGEGCVVKVRTLSDGTKVVYKRCATSTATVWKGFGGGY